MYTELTLDYEDRGTATSKRLRKSIPPYQFLTSLLQKEYLYPKFISKVHQIGTSKKPVGMTGV